MHGGETEHGGGLPTGVAGRDRRCRVGEGESEGVMVWGGRSQIMEHCKYHDNDFRLHPTNTWSSGGK